jgi:hypothetical protein
MDLEQHSVRKPRSQVSANRTKAVSDSSLSGVDIRAVMLHFQGEWMISITNFGLAA